MLKTPPFVMLGLKMNGRLTPTLFFVNWVLQDCLFSHGFQTWISRAMLNIPCFVVLGFKMNPRVTSTLFFFVKLGVERLLVYQGISKMEFPGDDNPTFCSAWL